MGATVERIMLKKLTDLKDRIAANNVGSIVSNYGKYGQVETYKQGYIKSIMTEQNINTTK
jgi:hypothetical protein